MEQPNEVEVKLLKYTFRFKRLRWREEFALKHTSDVSPQRLILANALLEVSGIKPSSSEEAMRVMAAIPMAIIERVYIVWKGSFPPARHFTSFRLYKAPEPFEFHRTVDEEVPSDTMQDRKLRMAETQYGSEQLKEIREVENKILHAAKKRDGGYRGAIPATRDESDL